MNTPVRRTLIVLGLLAATALGVCGAYLLCEAWSIVREGQKARTTPFLEMEVDLSRAGAYKGTIRNFFSMAHSRALTLRVDPPLASDNALAPLVAHYEMPAADGESGPVDDWEPGQRPSMDNSIDLCRVSMSHKGDIPFTLVVEKPAVELAGRKQMIVGRYSVCGLEGMVAMFAGGIGIVLMIVALVVALPLVSYSRRLRREGRW